MTNTGDMYDYCIYYYIIIILIRRMYIFGAYRALFWFCNLRIKDPSLPYRPVSLMSVICKLFERLIIGHMVNFLFRHKLLNSSQRGFLKAR